MAIDDPGVIDIVSIDATGCVVLTVSDHLDWSDTIGHQTVLQAKLNCYLAFIESGDILEKYPTARDRNLMIEVVTQYQPDTHGLRFLEKVRAVVVAAGFEFAHRQFSGPSPEN